MFSNVLLGRRHEAAATNCVNPQPTPRAPPVNVMPSGRYRVVDWRKTVLKAFVLVCASSFWVQFAGPQIVLLGIIVAVGIGMLLAWLALDPVAADIGEMTPESCAFPPNRTDLPDMTLEEVLRHNSRQDAWIVIQDCVYDVTPFVLHHPGGPLPIWDVAGRDATDPFLAFHPAGTEKKLRPFLVGRLVGYESSQAVAEFRQLRQDLIDQGFYKCDRSFFARKFTKLLFVFVAAVVCALQTGNSSWKWAWTIVGAVLLGIFFQQLAGLGHDVGHNSITHLRIFDRCLGLVIGNLLLGISIGWWKKSHNTHHVVPNSIEYDPDIQHLPFMAPSEQYFSNVYSMYHDWTLKFGKLERSIVGYQHILYMPLMAIARVNLYAQSIFFICGQNSHSQPVNWRWAEALTLGSFFCWLTALCRLLPTASHIAVFVLISHAISGLLHIQITISHFSREHYDGVSYKNDEESWWHTQLATTMDVDCPEWLDWFHIGLQFQIEHHLFPRIPRHNLRKVQRRVMELCRKHDIHHHNVPWFQSLWETYRALRVVALKARELDSSNVRFRDTLLYAGLQAEG